VFTLIRMKNFGISAGGKAFPKTIIPKGKMGRKNLFEEKSNRRFTRKDHEERGKLLKRP